MATGLLVSSLPSSYVQVVLDHIYVPFSTIGVVSSQPVVGASVPEVLTAYSTLVDAIPTPGAPASPSSPLGPSRGI